MRLTVVCKIWLQHRYTTAEFFKNFIKGQGGYSYSYSKLDPGPRNQIG